MIGLFTLRSFRVIDKEQPLKRTKVVDWTTYSTYDEINDWFDLLVAQYPGEVTHVNIGKSYEGRDIRGVKVNLGGGVKKTVVFEGTIHAREWISSATTTWMVNELLTSSDPEVQMLARTYEWIVLPVVNPDGYVYTWTKDRTWRKTRRPSNLLCFGADPNRNWDNHFNEGGSSKNPCSDIYAGNFPFSEPETKQLSDYILTIPNLTAYFAFHAYGQMMMTPYGWTKDLLGNYQELYEIGLKGVEALTGVSGTQYRLGSIGNVICESFFWFAFIVQLNYVKHLLDIASGSSIDWVKDATSLNVTFAYELRDDGRHGFNLPADQIVDNSVEVFASIVAILKESQLRGIA